MTITQQPDVGVALAPPSTRRMTRQEIAAERRARRKLAAIMADRGAWRLHVLVAVGITIGCGNRREIVEALREVGFTVDIDSPCGPVGRLPLSHATVIRPRPVDDERWRCTVGFDTELAVPARLAVAPDLTAIVACTSSDITVATARVDVLACLAAVSTAATAWMHGPNRTA